MACSMWFLDQGRNLGPGHWEHGVSAISEKSLKLFFSENLSWPLIRTVKLYISNLAFGVSMIALPPISRGFPGGSGVKRPPASVGGAGDSVSIPGSGRSLGEENGNPLQCSCLENPMDRGAWRATVHGVMKSWTRLSTQTVEQQARTPQPLSCGARQPVHREEEPHAGGSAARHTHKEVFSKRTTGASLVAQLVKSPPAMGETWV